MTSVQILQPWHYIVNSRMHTNGRPRRPQHHSDEYDNTNTRPPDDQLLRMFFFFFIWHPRAYLGFRFPPTTKAEATGVMLCKGCQEASKLDRSVLVSCSREKCICGVFYCTTSRSRSMKSPQIPWRQVQFSLPSLDPKIRVKIIIWETFLVSITEWLRASKLWPGQVSLYFSKYVTGWRRWKDKKDPLLVAS